MTWNKQITVIVVCLLSTLSSNLLVSSSSIFSSSASSNNKNNIRLQQNTNTPTNTITTTSKNNGFCTTFKTIELPVVTINYRSTNTTLTIRMTTSYQGYIGFGLSNSGTMEGTEAIIGIPGDVSKYTLGSYFAKLVGDTERQATLRNTSFVQDEDGSVLEFTKLLKDISSGGGVANDRYNIDGFGLNKFIWAVGNDNRLDYHAAFGSFPLELDPYDCEDDGVEIIPDRIQNYKLLFALHGIFAILAFGIFMPLAITASRARNLLDFEFRKKKAWYVLHTSLNSLAYGLTCVLVLLVMVAYSKKGKDHFNGSKHEIVGLVTLLLMTVQVVAGVLRPDPYVTPPPPPPGSSSTSSLPSEKVVHNEPPPQLPTNTNATADDVSYSDSLSGEMMKIENEARMAKEKGIELIETDDVTSIGDTEEKTSSTQEQQPPKVRLVRTIWRRSHVVMGISTFGCGIFQMHSGVTLYSTLFQSGSKTYIGLLWGLLGFVFLSVTVTIVHSKMKKI